MSESYSVAQQQAERRELVAGLRAEALASELEAVRSKLASCEMRLSQAHASTQERDREIQVLLDTRVRDEKLLKARLEVVEREFREVRDRKARELAGAKRDATGAVAHAEMAAAGLYKRALHSNVSCWLALAVVGWRRHELARGMQKWQTTAKALAMEYTVHSLLAAAHSQAMAKVSAGSEEQKAWRALLQSAGRRVVGILDSAAQWHLKQLLQHWRLITNIGVYAAKLGRTTAHIQATQEAMLQVAEEREVGDAHNRRVLALAQSLVSR
uniref:Uncharacterized protein n=1 Tax=Haptolina ericina TaxID=156174 RepID=A0A7S3AVP1_9EUKA